MPAPIRVKLEPHDPAWAQAAAREAAALAGTLGPVLQTVHHIGSTAIPGIAAKPILDLLPVVSSLAELDTRRPSVEQLGYEWWGEYGLTGRRFCTRSDPEAGRRVVNLHCWEAGSSEIGRHLAFRDHLRARPDLARAYEAEKMRCRRLHAEDSHAYADCKSAWVRAAEAEALAARGTGL